MKASTRAFAIPLLLSFLAVSSRASLAEAHAGRPLPVIFAHGLGVSKLPYEALSPLKTLFTRRGRALLLADTPVNGTIEERAAILRQEIDRLVPSGKVHLVGHSMGGLDARLAVHRYGLAGRVASISTLSTPHHGSDLADFVVRFGDRAESGWLNPLFRLFANDLRAARDLTTSHMDGVFNAEVKDDPRVRYFSWGFFIPTPVRKHSVVPWLWWSHSIVERAGFPLNDGMVSVESARWGEFMGALPGDHYSETGPVPLVGGPGYLDIFAKVVDNLDRLENSGF